MGHKSILGHPFCGPRLIINDAKLTTFTPDNIWRYIGMFAIDHCVEAFCRLKPEDTEIDRGVLEGFKCLVPGMLRTNKDSIDEQARLDCMLGVNRVMITLKKGITPGDGRGISHQLGTICGDHGKTSYIVLPTTLQGETNCALFPAIMEHNARVNVEKQESMKAALWSEPSVSSVLKQQGLVQTSSDLADALEAVFREIGMPTSLKEKEAGQDGDSTLAKNRLKHSCCIADHLPGQKEIQICRIIFGFIE